LMVLFAAEPHRDPGTSDSTAALPHEFSPSISKAMAETLRDRHSSPMAQNRVCSSLKSAS
jgi:hypothetical protein